jgi:hypothetical protein
MGEISYNGDQDYKNKTAAVIAQIEKNEAGRTILAAIRNSDKDLTIAPYDWRAGSCNSVTHADNPIGSAPLRISAVSPTPWYKGNEDNLLTPNDERYDLQPPGYKGSGDGSDATIYFSSDIYNPQSNCETGVIATAADEILFHEMIHALREMQAVRNAVPTEDSVRKYDNEEEFLAIVATNVYISASGGIKLRADHDGHFELKPPLNTSAGFLTDPGNLKLMKLHRLMWAPTFLALAHVITAKFNPFRELDDNLAYLGHSTRTLDIDSKPLGTYPRPRP